MGIIRDGFVVLRNWATAINKLPEENQLECYKALAEYGLTGQRPEHMSQIVDAMIESFSVGMENAIERYNASVENGKKGGAPFGNQNARKNVDNSTQNNPKQPKTTTIDFENNQNNQNQPKTSENNPNVNVNVNDNVNVFSQSKNYAGAREGVDNSDLAREFWTNHFSGFFTDWMLEDMRKLGLEVVDVMIEALQQSRSNSKMMFNRHKYDYGELFQLFNILTSEDFGKIVWSLKDAEIEQSRPLYILGALINKAKEKKLAEERKHLPKI